MTAAVVRPKPVRVWPLAPASPHREDRWLGESRRGRKLTAAMMPVLAGSVLLHALLLAAAITGARPPHPPSAEPIAVEVVQETSKPPKSAGLPAPASAEQASTAAPMLKPTLAPVPAHEPAPPPVTPKPVVYPAKDAAAADAKLKSLRDELASLKAEQAALKSEQAAAEQDARQAEPTTQTVGRALTDGLGPLPNSFQAVALPSATGGEGEATDYSALVFSALAKAKGIGREQGRPGTAGVRFDIDAQGHLTDAEIVLSSGIKTLDEEALAVVRRAAPFPAPPPGARRSFSANVSFVADAAPP